MGGRYDAEIQPALRFLSQWSLNGSRPWSEGGAQKWRHRPATSCSSSQLLALTVVMIVILTLPNCYSPVGHDNTTVTTSHYYNVVRHGIGSPASRVVGARRTQIPWDRRWPEPGPREKARASQRARAKSHARQSHVRPSCAGRAVPAAERLERARGCRDQRRTVTVCGPQLS